jgi:hypothetical protein
MDRWTRMLWLNLWNRLQKGKDQKDVLYRFTMITNQVGDVSKSVSYDYQYKEQKDSYHKTPEMKPALADLLAMTLMMALNEGINLEELDKLAQDRLDDFIKTRMVMI